MEDNITLKRGSSISDMKDFQDILSSEEKQVKEHILSVKTFKWHLKITHNVVVLLVSIDGEIGFPFI